MLSVGLWCKQCRLYFVVGNIMSRARPYLLCRCLVWISSSSHCLCEIHRAWSSAMRYSTLRGKTRISVSEPYGIKLNLYCCNIDYLQKNSVGHHSRHFQMHWLSLLWKAFLSDPPYPEPGKFASSYENVYYLISTTSKTLCFFFNYLCVSYLAISLRTRSISDISPHQY